MKQFFITFAGVLAGLVLFFVVAPIVLITLLVGAVSRPAPNPSQMVLSIDLREELPDQRPTNPFAALGGGAAFLDVLTKIDAARSDNAVKGIFIRANTDGMPAAQAEELRTALRAFKASGKFVVAHIQSDGVRLSLAGYMAVASADELWLQDASDFQAMGLTSANTFLGDTLRRFHVEAQFEQREEFKNAPNEITQTGFTPAHRLATQTLMQGLYDVMTAAIAEDRGLQAPQLVAAIEATPMTADQAKTRKLVDRLGRPEDAEAAALARADHDAELVDIERYRPRAHFGAPVIAVVTGEGAIVSGPNQASPFGGEASMNSDAIARALLDASEDSSVKAIVFRVSSGGGSVVASDQILNALRIAKSRGKKVVVSMGEMAASGGYYIAADADEIVASATTITGSIGVFGGKIVLGPALEHYASVHSETVSLGSPLVTMFSADAPFTPQQRQTFASLIDRTYGQFLALVAEGRHLTVAQTREVARGRVWTGKQALERRLVDRIGGFDVALQRARVLAGLQPDAAVQLRFYPAQQTPAQALEALLGASSDNAEAMAALRVLAADPHIAAAIEAMRQDRAAVRAEADGLRVR